MKKIKIVLILLISASVVVAQQNPDEEHSGFQKDRLFTGGSVSLGFGTNTFQFGVNPVLGYNLTKWIDAGIVVNYNYNSYRDVAAINDKLRTTTYGGGAFAQIYPLRFLFAHLQFEHNFIKQKYIAGSSGFNETSNVDANSLLAGVGLATERYPGDSRPFFYLMVLFDVLNQDFSPYTRSDGTVIPILRAGIHVPLFQGKKGF
jgi:hypothetical protein